MEKSFAVLKLTDKFEEIPIKIPFEKILSKDYVYRKKLDKIYSRIPIIKECIEILGVQGYQVQLPLTKDIIKEKGVNYTKRIVDETLDDLTTCGCNAFIMPDEIIEIGREKEVLLSNGKALSFLLMEEIVEKILEVKNLTYKDTKFVLVDGNESVTDYCLDILYDKINYLSIITPRPEYFNEKSEKILEETGLILSILEEPIIDTLESDIVINCSNSQSKAFYFFNKKTVLVDFISEKKHIKNILLKRKDIRLIDEVGVSIHDERYKMDVLQGVVFSQNRVLRSWSVYGYNNEMFDRIKRSLNQYNIQINDLYEYGHKIN
ncbi:hypothetical protein EDC19_2348 [Natranaerovirga hydrolytica]|uniref:Uncharacterized protein n=1 Tax=Natranaerovirga hydrolytica TaxID=680378 RepID=A0A4R1MJS9_9FIRM|nr:hypothetical protein [Natranaerovirga hydrolytica]TCK90579.1 hypothetical protein EDC19_2348 [Natranaerovirga hydrolytica]